MSAPLIWMRNNMLATDKLGRQLTDAELKVQRSLETLSIPEWYLNKRSNPPKILNNTPLHGRTPSWKNPDWKRTSVMNLSTLTTSDTASSKSSEISESNNYPSTGTYKVQRQQKSPNSTATTEKMDTTIPDIKQTRYISKTFPKMSPSRKIHNINIVLSGQPPFDLSHDFDENLIPDATNRNTYLIIKRKKSAKTNNDLSKSSENSESTHRRTSSPYEEQEDKIQPPEPIYAEITPKTKSSFEVRATSTPKLSPTCLFSSTNLEETPKVKRAPSKNILNKLSFFEDSWRDTSMDDDSEKASQSMQERTVTLKSSWREKPQSVSYEETPRAKQKQRDLLERNIKSIEPIIFESVSSNKFKLVGATSVRDIVRNVENIVISDGTPGKRYRLKFKKSNVPAESKDLGESSKTPVQLKKTLEKNDADSFSSRFPNFKRMSVIPEEVKEIKETEMTPVQLNDDTHSSKFRNSRRMSMVPEDLKDIGELSKTPVQQREDKQLKKNVESPSTRFSKSRRTSIVPEALEDLRVVSSKTPVKQSKGIQLEEDAHSPSTRFLTSRRKSIELENVVRSKQPPKKKSVVHEIIKAMMARGANQVSLQKQSNVPGGNQNFVKTVVDALEKGDSSLLDETIQRSFTSTIRNEDDLGSTSESDIKSSPTISSKDTESSSESDQRSPILLESDDSHKAFDFDVSLDTSKISEQKHEEDDSVYWIPVSRCKLPRTSSLLSMMSRLSTNGDSSPSVSPIKSDSENENEQVPWGATFKKNRGLSRNLFRIDETVVLDSGYSDRSEKSAMGCSMTDSNWSEDTQYKSETEVGKNRITRASRRRSGIGATFRVSD